MFTRAIPSSVLLLAMGASCSQRADDRQSIGNMAIGGSANAGTSGSGAGTVSAAPTAGGTTTSAAGASGATSAGAGVSNGGLGGQASAGSAGQSGGGSTGLGSAGLTGSTAGSGGGGTAGTAGVGGASTEADCDAITSLYCDDYEAQTEGMAPNGDFQVDGNGTLIVDGTNPFRGSKSIHLSAPVGSGSTVLQFNDQFPVNDLYGRAMFFVDSLPTEGHHWDIVYAVSNNGFNWEIGGMFGPFLLIVDPPDEGVSSDPFPVGEWFCLQWQFSYAGEGQDHTFHAKLNGTTLMNGEFTGMDAEGNTWGAGPWDVLRVGWTAYQDHDVDVEMWIDDLAFGEQELPCPSPP
jgi:hypothetical protein